MLKRDKYYLFIKKQGSVTGKELADHFGISRQAANKHVKALLKDGKIFKEGVTRAARYKPEESSREVSAPRISRKTYLIKGLEEHKVFIGISTILNLEKSMTTSSYAIVRHAFTEILNNAIDHSQSEKCLIVVELNQYECTFTIRDYGIGVFNSIKERFLMEDEHAALGQLLKGKTTTMEERHSGEGIFFTSKSGDQISFRSHQIQLSFDNLKESVIAEEKRFLRGTEVSFSISRRSRRDLSSIFNSYSPEEYDYHFEKTRVHVSLSPREHVSRSEARRLLFGLDKFTEIILDFKSVKGLGQGFADEIFRVFQGEHPEIIITIENESKVVRQMISHVQVDNK
jgi:anti-sigma regulatory factor (Ser/Thr protein kinase)